MEMKKRFSARSANPKGSAEVGVIGTAVIDSIGSQGDGVCSANGKQMHIPFSLPGESVSFTLTSRGAELVEVLRPSPERVESVCPYFGKCGGCSLQHWRQDRCTEWKASLVASALTRAGIEAQINTIKTYPDASRRRATFTAEKTASTLKFGFNAARSHEVISVERCPLLDPAIETAVPGLRFALTESLAAGEKVRISVTAAANGLDCAFDGPALPKLIVNRLTSSLSTTNIIRALWNGELLLAKSTPFIYFGDVKAPLATGAFLQAINACERDVAEFIATALAEGKLPATPICDLFAGQGAFAFRAAKFAPVVAYEANAEAVAALTSAAKEAKGLKTVTGVRRDLFRNPLNALELNKFAAAIIDPPRQGAQEQCRAIAMSKIGTAIMISCNPVTFARDAAILTAQGFRIARLVLFDQFKYSVHVEIAAVFRRA
jgi:23S rRNA (uracil1939-C5)-methyltransferase